MGVRVELSKARVFCQGDFDGSGNLTTEARQMLEQQYPLHEKFGVDTTAYTAKAENNWGLPKINWDLPPGEHKTMRRLTAEEIELNAPRHIYPKGFKIQDKTN